jgi:large conductance mechanosensitive channel
MFKSFIEFIRKRGVVGLAIGFLIGGSVSKFVTSFVQDVVQPTVGLIFGFKTGMQEWMLGPVAIGNFLSAFIDFLIIAIIVFVGFKILRLDRENRKEQVSDVVKS